MIGHRFGHQSVQDESSRQISNRSQNGVAFRVYDKRERLTNLQSVTSAYLLHENVLFPSYRGACGKPVQSQTVLGNRYISKYHL